MKTKKAILALVVLLLTASNALAPPPSHDPLAYRKKYGRK
jgi:hypothetical protein